MISLNRRSDKFVAIVLLAVGCLLMALVYTINEKTVDYLIKEDSRRTSESAAHYFETNIPDITQVVQGQPLAKTSQDFILSSLQGAGTKRFKIFSADGTFRFDSGQVDQSDPNAEPLGSINSDAQQAVATNQPVVELEEKFNNGGTELIAETYVPILRENEVIGVAEVYVDQTQKAALFRNTFYGTSIAIALIAALGFSIPAAGLYYRNKQKLLADENMRFLASHDGLTRLPNRATLLATVSKELSRCLENKKLAQIHCIDIDHFKEFNERYGHEFGDDVLCAVADALKLKLRQGDIVSRLGGDEFVVAQFGFADDAELVVATDRIKLLFDRPLVVQNKAFAISASIGTAVCPQHGTNAAQLLANADIAVYVMKSNGGNGQCCFESRFDEDKARKIELEGLIKEAVVRNNFSLHYQPLVKLRGNELKGFEALLRLKDANGKPVSPAEFIPVAEQSGAIDAIGAWVLKTACTTAKTWPDHLQISVNLSALQFKNQQIVGTIAQALQESGLEPHRLLLEITEGLLLKDTEAVLEQLRAIKALGAAIVMDDFGTGFSSLGYMLKFPFDAIKIDRSFVSAMDMPSSGALPVIETIAALGHTLRMSVTAEGVETEEQANQLEKLHCDVAQGYFFGRPMPAEDIASYIIQAYVNGDKLAEMPFRKAG